MANDKSGVSHTGKWRINKQKTNNERTKDEQKTNNERTKDEQKTNNERTMNGDKVKIRRK